MVPPIRCVWASRDPVLLDPFLEHEILLLPIVELVLEAGCAERDRLAEEGQVPEVGAVLCQVDVSR